MTAKSATQLWLELKVWYEDHLPEAVRTLNPGASEEAIAAVEKELRREIGRGLPQGLREIYGQNDGQQKGVICGMFFGLEFSSLSQMLSDWQVWCDIAGDDVLDLNADFREFSTLHPPNTIQNVYAHPGWLPFARDGGGNHLGVDLSPGPAGQLGQVVNFGRDEERRCVVAPSLEVFLEWLLAQHEAGNFHIATHNIDGQKMRRVQILNPPKEVFLGAVPILFGPKSKPPGL